MGVKKYILLVVVIFQIGIVVYLLKTITLRKDVLGEVKFNAVSNKDVKNNPYSDLKYFYEPDPYLADNEINEWVPMEATYSVKENTFNDKFDYPLAKASNTLRIITLGDSFTFGMYVNTEDNWTEKTEDLLNNQGLCQNVKKYEVINLGVYGYDFQYSVERYKLRGVEYNPDVVIWLLKGDDILQINEEIRGKEKMHYKLMNLSGEFQKEVEKGNMYPSFNRAYQEFVQQNNQQDILAKQKRYMADFRKMFAKSLFIVTFPTDSQQNKEFLKSISHEFNAIYSENLPSQTDESLVFPNDGHPNEKGHAAIAEDMYQILQENKESICPRR